MIYDSPYAYYESGTCVKDKIAKLDVIIEGLYDAAVKGADKAYLDEYQIDDGQSKIRTKYRSVEDIMKGIESFERIRQRLINTLNGRIVVLKDRNSLC